MAAFLHLFRDMPSPLWVLVLSRRLDIPSKHQSLARLGPVCSSKRTLFVAEARSLADLDNQSRDPSVLVQPEWRGTVAGVLFGLVRILTADANATLLLAFEPVGDDQSASLTRGIGEAIALARGGTGVVLFGTVPGSLGGRPQFVVARAKTVFDACLRHAPDASAPFIGALTLPTESRAKFLKSRYSRIPFRDLFSDVLAKECRIVGCPWLSSMAGAVVDGQRRADVSVHA